MGTMYSSIKAQTVWGENNSRTDFRNNAGLQGSAGAVSGFFQTYNPVNFPTGASSWWHLLDVRHSDPNNNYAMQFSGSYYDQNLYFRKTNNNPSQAWSKVLLETDNSINVQSTNFKVPNSFNIASAGRMHLSGPEKLFLLNQGGVYISYAWGGTGSLSVDGSTTLNGNVTANNAISVGGSTALNGYVTAQNGLLAMKGTSFEGSAKFSGSQWASHFTYGSNEDTYIRGGKSTSNVIIGDIGANVLIGSGVGANVIIGNGVTSTPAGYSLYVAEGILTEKVKVAVKTTANWSDNVFDRNYKLPTLSKVESFITKNQHLPGIPSAKEVVANGIDLGEMNAKLLGKIEELTLYMIASQKQVADLKKQVADLKKQVNNK